MGEYRDPTNFDPAGALFGRGKGKPLRARQRELMDDLLPKLEVSLEGQAPGTLDPDMLFGGRHDAYWLEIGFGGGEHLMARARSRPDIGFIGCEAFLNGVAKALAQIDDGKIENVRLFNGDARRLLSALSDASIERVFLLYPDPWPKTRHHKRRFISGKTLAEIERVLVSQGEFFLATDIPDYARWSLEHIRRYARSGGRLVWQAEQAADWRLAPEGWPGTRYEEKALREGRTPAYFSFRKAG